MKTIIILFFCVIAFNQFSAQTILVSGTISNNTSWNVDTVKVIGDITINDGAKLTISPGTRIEFQDFYRILVNGSLIAEGNAQDSIRFTMDDTTGLHNNLTTAGGWRGLVFEYITPVNDSSVLSYCVVEHAKKGLEINTLGAIGITQCSKVRISDCTIRRNVFNTWSGGINLIMASPIIKNNLFEYNRSAYGGAIGIYNNSEPRIIGNIMYQNFAINAGGAIMCQSSNPLIINNMICNNSTLESNCGPADGSGGIRLTNGSIAYLAGNVIANNRSGMNGGGIQCMYGSNASIINNTIVNNDCAFYGGGIYMIQSSPVLRNNIIWGNKHNTFNVPNQITMWSDDSEPVITNSDIEGGVANFVYGAGVTYSGYFINNISQDPLFSSPSVGSGNTFDGSMADWNITDVSPCKNSGNNDSLGIYLPLEDIAGNPRIVSSIIDMGAYEVVEINSTPDDFSVDKLSIHPNPTQGIIVLDSDTPLYYELYNYSGISCSKGINQSIDLTLFPAGVYFLRLTNKTFKVIKL